MNKESVDAYLKDGCGRCDRYQTPECKVHRWTDVLVAWRGYLLMTDLVEEMKWGSPCYTLNGKNVLMLVSFKDSCAISFLKGSALSDEDGVLELPGPNSRVARVLRFRSADGAIAQLPVAKQMVQKAIDLERSGIKVQVEAAAEPMPEQLEAVLQAQPELQLAFDALTPGRRRSFILHVSGAKQRKTRVRRAESCGPKILAGKGFNER